MIERWVSRCDNHKCNTVRAGTMFFCPDAMGLDTPVLFLCRKCDPVNYAKLPKLEKKENPRSKAYPPLGRVLIEE